jgi:hypothetical protein
VLVAAVLAAPTLLTISGTPKTECVLARWSDDFKTSEELTRWKGACALVLSPGGKTAFIKASRSLLDLGTRTATALKEFPLPTTEVFFSEAGTLRFIGLTSERDAKGFRWKGKSYPPPAELYGLMQQARLAHVFEWVADDWKEIETRSIEYDTGGVIAMSMYDSLESYPKGGSARKTRELTAEEARGLPPLADAKYVTDDEVLAFAALGTDSCFSSPPVAAKTTKGWKELRIKARPGLEDCLLVWRASGVVLLRSTIAGPVLFSPRPARSCGVLRPRWSGPTFVELPTGATVPQVASIESGGRVIHAAMNRSISPRITSFTRGDPSPVRGSSTRGDLPTK